MSAFVLKSVDTGNVSQKKVLNESCKRDLLMFAACGLMLNKLVFGCGVCDSLLGMSVGYLIRTRQKFGFPFLLFSIFLKLGSHGDRCIIKTSLQIFSQQCAHRALNYVILTLINS